ncbi:EF-hand domain pair [Plasmopara halstedii]|uniref:EF-hand domain pair n=1 Tax=Plasmopara halstedii TaxID=4781 RepID=A0A0P1AUN4_PLAHL|nr:EF-hand domain pair [Plasmopara halstedii]CEG44689.1 EF-hand domain pair [Plasmopara halstedii]|eukprot:XP_024581058.1 EF-hand domain pair [Plasmopara halstedii]
MVGFKISSNCSEETQLETHENLIIIVEMVLCWECPAFLMAVAPWCRDCKRQQIACVRVAVTEQWTPNFSLRFDLEVLATEEDDKTSVLYLMRLVNQRQILRTLEFTLIGAGSTKQRPQGIREDDGILDERLKLWLEGDGHIPAPSKEDLVRWLLTWMVLVPVAAEGESSNDTEWYVLLCGEKGLEDWIDDEEENVFSNEVCDASDFEHVCRNGNDVDDDCEDGERGTESEEDDMPPPYEGLETNCFEKILYKGRQESDLKQVQVNARSNVRSSKAIDVYESLKETRDLVDEQSVKRSICSSSQDFVKPSAASIRAEQYEKVVFKPTIVQLSYRIKTENLNEEYSDDQRFYYKELGTLHRNVRMMKKQQDKVEKLSNLHRIQLLNESARKMRAIEQSNHKAQVARRLIADEREYRDEMNVIEMRLKKASIALKRDRERIKRHSRIALVNTTKTLNGTVQVKPALQKEMESALGALRKGSTVYDHDGCRRNVERTGLTAKESALRSAMRKVRLLASKSKKGVTSRDLDPQRDGKFSHRQSNKMLRDENLFEQVEDQALPADESLTVDRKIQDLLGISSNPKTFFNANISGPEMRQIFSKYDPSSCGMVSLKDFQLVLDHLGVNHNDPDLKLLILKFHAVKDGYIDYKKFLAHVNLSDTGDEPTSITGNSFQSADHINLLASNAQNTSPRTSRILSELQNISSTQAELRRRFNIN